MDTHASRSSVAWHGFTIQTKNKVEVVARVAMTARAETPMVQSQNRLESPSCCSEPAGHKNDMFSGCPILVSTQTGVATVGRPSGTSFFFSRHFFRAVFGCCFQLRRNIPGSFGGALADARAEVPALAQPCRFAALGYSCARKTKTKIAQLSSATHLTWPFELPTLLDGDLTWRRLQRR